MIALAWPYARSCSARSQLTFSSKRKRAGPSSTVRSQSDTSRPVQWGMRASRLRWVSSEKTWDIGASDAVRCSRSLTPPCLTVEALATVPQRCVGSRGARYDASDACRGPFRRPAEGRSAEPPPAWGGGPGTGYGEGDVCAGATHRGSLGDAARDARRGDVRRRGPDHGRRARSRSRSDERDPVEGSRGTRGRGAEAGRGLAGRYSEAMTRSARMYTFERAEDSR